MFCDRPVERRDDVADVAAAVGVEDLQADQVRAGRDARARAARVVAVAGDDPGDVRAVAVVVVGGVRPLTKSTNLATRPDPRSSCQLVTPESIIATPDAGAVEAERVVHPAGSDRGAGPLEGAFDSDDRG